MIVNSLNVYKWQKKVKPIFRDYDTTGLLLYAKNILLKMTLNADLFVDPVPDLAMLDTLVKIDRIKEFYYKEH